MLKIKIKIVDRDMGWDGRDFRTNVEDKVRRELESMLEEGEEVPHLWSRIKGKDRQNLIICAHVENEVVDLNEDDAFHVRRDLELDLPDLLSDTESLRYVKVRAVAS